MGKSPPFMYGAERRPDSQLSGSTFDPKAVTRASWDSKPARPRHEGPLISLNLHPDAHAILPYRVNHESLLGPRSKQWIKWLRQFQLFIRLLELNGALGILVLMVLMTNMSTVTGWVLRISPGIAAVHCIYAVYHLSRSAAGRTPTSSAAYHFFTVALDLFTMSIYGFGAYTIQTKSDTWSTRLSNQSLMGTFVPALYYTMIGAGSLHVVSLGTSLWLGWMFRKISLLPPDMNPLEDHLTARPLHKRNRSSVATSNTAESEKTFSTPPGSHIQPDLSHCRPSSMPFLHTRDNSRTSLRSYDSRVNLPSRQYQVLHNNSPRNSVISATSASNAIPESSYQKSPIRFKDTSQAQRYPHAHGGTQGRVAKFTETWMPTDSLISRTNQRAQELGPGQEGYTTRGSKAYSALAQRYNLEDSSDSEYGDENNIASDVEADGLDLGDSSHPNPLRSNPTSPRGTLPGTKTPVRPRTTTNISAYSPLSELGSNERLKNDSRGMSERGTGAAAYSRHYQGTSLSSDDVFYAQPYGDVKRATPPIMVGANRKISSGNDYVGKSSSKAYERRNVSGKAAEEGRVRDQSTRGWLGIERGY